MMLVSRINQTRRIALLAHRYVGLVMTVFLVVAGLSGSLLVFYDPLDAALNPRLRRAAPATSGEQPLDPFELRDRIQAQLPAGKQHREVQLDQRPGETMSFWLEEEEDQWKELFADPYTGVIVGERKWGDLSEGTVNLMPFMYELHYSLALGEVGTLLFGIVALLWTIDCFVGAYLTLPQPVREGSPASRKPWLKRWAPAWLLRAGKLFSAVFTWHRASGLWVWAMLLVFAWSAVGLNLYAVYEPVMRTVTGMQKIGHDVLPELSKPYPEPKLSLHEAHARGRELMAAQAKARGFRVEREDWIGYADDHGVYAYRVASSLDISDKRSRTQVYFDGQDGRFVAFEAPTGISAGNTISSWLMYLHFGHVGGLWYRIFVSAMGVAVATLSVTGVWIWLRKRQKRSSARERSGATSDAPAAGLAIDTVRMARKQ